jgi:hypothetical protein
VDATYEIFKDLPEGPIWVERVAALNNINERLKSLNEINPGQYFAYDVHEARIIARLSSETKQDSIVDNSTKQSASDGQGAYDVFRQNEKGEPIWVETVVNLSNLEKRLMKLASIKPGIYMVFDPTEEKFIAPFKKSA